ncbi:MAG: sigma-54-dependent Fis family transcriptional regulator, partial [Syntrophobacteraceae bacterium]|nr:sigma-54-dependent Fis family transcriptional regulator [Syntrophobacteraceae bacterium]
KGRFELAHEGTLFLDEISEMSPPLQVKLLRVLQEMEFERVGGTQSLKVDVRMVAASNRELRVEVADGRFRSDLFYRLNVVHVHLPPLRERKDDIPLLVNHFLKKFAGEGSLCGLKLEPEAMRLLLDYAWPGNVRELENVIERAVILCNGEEILAKDLPPEVHSPRREMVEPEGGADDRGDGELRRVPPEDRTHQVEPGERLALRELSELVDSGMLTRIGKGRACRYVVDRDSAGVLQG